MTGDEKAIRSLVETWFSASKAGDTATVLSLMTDDVIFMVPGQEPFGKKEFAAASEGMSGMKIDGTFEIQEIAIMGDWAYMRNHISMSMTLPGQDAPVRRSGYTLTLLRKEADGQWRLARDANLAGRGKMRQDRGNEGRRSEPNGIHHLVRPSPLISD